VVGAALGGLHRLGLVAGQPEFEAQRGQGHRPETESGDQQHGHRPTQHEPRPASTSPGRPAAARPPRVRSPPGRPALRTTRDSTRPPKKPNSAGTRVRATSTARATAPAPPMPILVSSGIPTTPRPTRAMKTVAPAKTTA